MATLLQRVTVTRLVTDSGAKVVTVAPATAGSKWILYGAGGNVVSSTGFTKRTGTGGNLEADVLDRNSTTGETSISLTFSGSQNWTGLLEEWSAGLSFIAASNGGTSTGFSTDTTIDNHVAPRNANTSAGTLLPVSGLTGTQKGMLFSVHALSTGTGTTVGTAFSKAARWHGNGPRANGVDLANQPGLASGANLIVRCAHADVDATHSYPRNLPAGQYAATSTLLASSLASLKSYVCQALYLDTSGTASTTFPNRVVARNTEPGVLTGNWYAPTALTGGIAGYTDKASYSPGDTVSFKVDSSNLAFRVEVYQWGWHQDDTYGARNVIGEQTYITGTPTAQAAPTVDATLGHISCDTWTTNATWTVPADADPGIYTVIYRRQDAGNTGLISLGHFVIRDATSTGVVVVIPDLGSVRPYNPWGAPTDHGNFATGVSSGRSLYQAGSDGATANFAHRAYAFSQNCPTATQSCVGQTYLFDAVYGLVQFLEAQGYNLTYLSDVDLHNDPHVLESASVVVMAGHHEYMSTNIYNAWRNAIAAKVNMLGYSSNVAGWRIEAHPTLAGHWICYKDDGSRDDTPGFDGGTGINPSGHWTGIWRDPTAAGGNANTDVRREADLTGAAFVASGPISRQMTYDVTSLTTFPLWRNSTHTAFTDLNNNIGFEVESASGKPGLQNLVIVASTSFAVTTASNPAGTVYHTSTTVTNTWSMARTSSGALVLQLGWRAWWSVARFLGSSPVAAVSLDIQNMALAALRDLGQSPTNLTELRLGIDTTPTDPAIGAITGGNDAVALAYGLTVPAASSAFFALLAP